MSGEGTARPTRLTGGEIPVATIREPIHDRSRALPGPAVRDGEPDGGTVPGPIRPMNLGSMIQEHRMRADGTVRLLNQEPDTMKIDIESIKRDAKRISRATTITHSQALDVLAVQNGFTHWGAWLTHIEAEIKRRSDAISDGTTPSALMSRVVQNWNWSGHPMLSGTRHLIASGSASMRPSSR